MASTGFTGKQKQYLEGLASGLRLAQRSVRARPAAAQGESPELALAPGAPAPGGPDQALWDAQDRFVFRGEQLAPEENAKRRQPPEDLWARISRLAREQRFPEGDEVFLYKFHGLFYVSPSEEAFMCRLRFAAGVIKAYQLRGICDLAERYGDPLLQLTARSNVQLRGIGAGATIDVLSGLLDLGIVTRGAGGDGVRNLRASPTSGFDRRELLDTSSLARQLQHRLLSGRGLQALPRKLTLAFDGGGAISAMPASCDVGFRAVTVEPGAGPTPGVYFRLLLGGACRHARPAQDAGVVVTPDRCLEVFEHILQIYVEHGERTNRRRARLGYLLDSWGMPRFMAELGARLGKARPEFGPDPLPQLPLDRCVVPAPPDPHAHIGFHSQKEPGTSYVGIVVPGARLSLEQARALARIAEDYGQAELRLTPRQNLLIPWLSNRQLGRVKRELSKLSLGWEASVFRAGLVACTGTAGCPFAEGNTKRCGEELVRHLETRFQFPEPLSMHVSGCQHGCGQHDLADIGLLARGGVRGSAEAERYQLWIGGHSTSDARIARELESDVPAREVPRMVQDVVDVYLERRRHAETFRDFVGRVALPDLERWAAERHGSARAEAG
jgi:ferredoxin-nitrite reductase